MDHSPSRDLETDGSVYLAEAFIDRGRYERALDLLQTAEPELSRVHHDILSARFYNAQAAALFGVHRTPEGGIPLMRAMEILLKRVEGQSAMKNLVSIGWSNSGQPTRWEYSSNWAESRLSLLGRGKATKLCRYELLTGRRGNFRAPSRRQEGKNSSVAPKAMNWLSA